MTFLNRGMKKHKFFRVTGGSVLVSDIDLLQAITNWFYLAIYIKSVFYKGHLKYLYERNVYHIYIKGCAALLKYYILHSTANNELRRLR